MEKRNTERRRTYKGGKIVFNNDRSAIDCTIKNMSRGGAALNVASSLGVPNEFTLVVGPENVQKSCRVAWKTETLIGIAFLEA